MQIKSLPLIKNLKQKVLNLVLKGKKAPQSQNPQKNQENQENQPQNPSPNLLTPIATKSFVMKSKPKLAVTSKNLAILTIVIFGALFITNMVFQIMLNRGEVKRDELISDIQKNAYVEEQVRGISNATNLYQDTKNTNIEVSKHLPQIVSSLEENLVVNRIFYKRDKKQYLINASTFKATSYAGMIAQVLQNEYVDSITLEFVDYKPQVNKYTADFSIKLK